MTNEMNSVEVTAPSLDEAVRQALESLGAQEDDVVIEILSTPRSGLLGLGSRPAKVRVTRKAPFDVQTGVIAPSAAATAGTEAAAKADSMPAATTLAQPGVSGAGAESLSEQAQHTAHAGQAAPSEPAEEPKAAPQTAQKSLEEQLQEAVAIIRETMQLMGETVEISSRIVEPQDGDTAAIEVDLKGENSGLLIGRRGQTLEALEYIVNRILARRIENAVPVLLDVESYNARRSQRLQRLALSLGEKVKRQRKALRLKPMSPRERRVVHMALRDDPLVTTESTGAGYLRAIKILPVDSASKATDTAQKRGRS